jgi:hypothetical protein
MAWAKVDDQWFAHRKVVGLSLAARGLWTTVLSWSCAQRSPLVPTHMVAFLAGGQDITAEVGELVDAGLWIADDVLGGWTIHDWAEYQDKSLSEKRSEAGKKGGTASGEARRKQTDEPNAKQTKQTDEANAEAGALPGPSRPGPTRPETRGARKRAAQLPDGWRPDDLTLAKLRQKYPHLDLDRELEQFRDHAASKGRTAKDWTAAFRMWARKADEWANDQPNPATSARGQPPAVGTPEWDARQRDFEHRAAAILDGGTG